MLHVACQRLAGKERPVGLIEAQPHWVLLLLSGLIPDITYGCQRVLNGKEPTVDERAQFTVQ